VLVSAAQANPETVILEYDRNLAEKHLGNSGGFAVQGSGPARTVVEVNIEPADVFVELLFSPAGTLDSCTYNGSGTVEDETTGDDAGAFSVALPFP